MAYLTELLPRRGEPMAMAPGIRRIVADNPGPMTYHGTNTYLIDGADGVSVVDPGPDDSAHLSAVLQAAGAVARILITHSHIDHVAGLPRFRAMAGAPVYAYAADLAPDHILADGDEVVGWTALHTPGHAPDHLCFARDDGVVMSADHVMGWSSSIVSPPDGDMAAYFLSLERMLARNDRLYLPGHGPAIDDPKGHTRFLLDHRIGREAAIVAALQAGRRRVPEVVDAVYTALADHLRPAAERSVLSHLVKLKAEGRVARAGGFWVIPAPSFDPASPG